MAISKVKLPDNTTQDLHDSRIPGVDTTVTSGSSNVVTSGAVFTAIQNSGGGGGVWGSITGDLDDQTDLKDALDAKQDEIATVNVTVDNNTGTPSASASVSGSTLSLVFSNLKGATGETGATGARGPQGPQGPQGEQGNTGSSVDYPYELVNNLTTNDATKGLSAAMGKNIEDRMPAQVDESGWYLVDELLNIAMKYDEDGLDVAKVSAHLKSLLGGGTDFLQVVEDGLFFVDGQMNIGAKLTMDGFFAKNLMSYEII
jgi:hypothetical protein